MRRINNVTHPVSTKSLLTGNPRVQTPRGPGEDTQRLSMWVGVPRERRGEKLRVPIPTPRERVRNHVKGKCRGEGTNIFLSSTFETYLPEESNRSLVVLILVGPCPWVSGQLLVSICGFGNSTIPGCIPCRPNGGGATEHRTKREHKKTDPCFSAH